MIMRETAGCKLKKSERRGFTIVELLIVIVVIAVLASITVVAFNGIQDRAKASKVNAAIDSYIKLLEMYKVDNGSYPDVTMDHNPGYNVTGTACLGKATHYPATDGFIAGACMRDTDVGYENNFHTTSATLETLLAPYGTLPDASGAIARDGPLYWRGPEYDRGTSGNPDRVMITWALKGRQDCGKDRSVSYHPGNNTTFCVYSTNT